MTISNFPANASDLRPLSLIAARQFQTNLIAKGHELLEDCWLGSTTPHRIRCVNSHLTSVRPHDVQKGGGPCKYCWYGSDRAHSEYLAFLSENGHEDLENGHWLGNNTPHRIRCVNDHLTSVRPHDIRRGQGACKYCSYGSDRAHSEYLAFLSENGHEDLENGHWLGNNTPHRIRCVNGHLTAVRPNNIKIGQGACLECYVSHDVFYIVTHTDGSTKFGITSGNPRPRLNEHASQGYSDVEFLCTNLPPRIAKITEDQIKVDLWNADYRPKMGKEWFGPEAKNFILDLAKTYLSDEMETKEHMREWAAGTETHSGEEKE